MVAQRANACDCSGLPGVISEQSLKKESDRDLLGVPALMEYPVRSIASRGELVGYVLYSACRRGTRSVKAAGESLLSADNLQIRGPPRSMAVWVLGVVLVLKAMCALEC